MSMMFSNHPRRRSWRRSFSANSLANNNAVNVSAIGPTSLDRSPNPPFLATSTSSSSSSFSSVFFPADVREERERERKKKKKSEHPQLLKNHPKFTRAGRFFFITYVYLVFSRRRVKKERKQPFSFFVSLFLSLRVRACVRVLVSSSLYFI